MIEVTVKNKIEVSIKDKIEVTLMIGLKLQ